MFKQRKVTTIFGNSIFNLFLEVSKLEELEFKLEKNIGIQIPTGKIRKVYISVPSAEQLLANTTEMSQKLSETVLKIVFKFFLKFFLKFSKKFSKRSKGFQENSKTMVFCYQKLF